MKRLLILLAMAMGALTATAAMAPNILFILADDLGWSDLACYGHKYHHTPNLDRLAKAGMRFTQAYAPAPICSASRAALLTGKTPARLHFEFVTKEKPGSQDLGQPLQAPSYPTNLPLEETTTAEILAKAGYHTAYFGKWHLNMHAGAYLAWSDTHGPLQQGFREGDSDFGSHTYAYYKAGDRSPLALKAGEFSPDTLTDQVVAFLGRKGSEPFFVQWAHYYVHDPVHTRVPWLLEKYRNILPAGTPEERVAYAAMVETLDHQVGRVLEALAANGLAEKTLVVFTSDNGGNPEYTANAPHRGSKWNLYEGGIRVPIIARWPGKIGAGKVNEQAVHGCDLLPTFEELAGLKAPGDAVRDGISLAPLLTGKVTSLAERSLLWHFPYYHPEKGFKKAPSRIGVNDFVISQTRPQSAIRVGNHKLIHFDESGLDELYDLAADPAEAKDLAKEKPDVAKQLRERLQAELKASNARFAVSAGKTK